MRPVRLLLLLLLAGCGADPLTMTTVAVGTTAGSVAVMHRTPIDALWSLATGRDCSVVRLDQGKSYCKPKEPPPEPPPYCTQTLGVANCWSDPEHMPGIGPQLGDGPGTLTPAQEVDRTSGGTGATKTIA